MGLLDAFKKDKKEQEKTKQASFTFPEIPKDAITQQGGQSQVGLPPPLATMLPTNTAKAPFPSQYDAGMVQAKPLAQSLPPSQTQSGPIQGQKPMEANDFTAKAGITPTGMLAGNENVRNNQAQAITPLRPISPLTQNDVLITPVKTQSMQSDLGQANLTMPGDTSALEKQNSIKKEESMPNDLPGIRVITSNKDLSKAEKEAIPLTKPTEKEPQSELDPTNGPMACTYAAKEKSDQGPSLTITPAAPSAANSNDSQTEMLDDPTFSEPEVIPSSDAASIVEKPKIGELKIFNKIALLGVSEGNSDSIDQVIDYLSGFRPTFIFDSNKGYVQNILKKLKELKLKSVGVYHKPYLSDQADESQEGSDVDAEISIIYSNFFDLQKHLLREAKLFIVFATPDFKSFSETLNLVSVSLMYHGQHKPVILFGEHWAGVLEAIKNNFKFDSAVLEKIIIVRNIEEFELKVSELEREYASKNKVDVQKIFDRRIEGDESDFILKS